MPTTLILTVHPEPRSFTAQWARASAAAEAAAGREVLTSDLYAMGFDPALGPRGYPAHDPARPFDPLKAMERLPPPPDIAAEHDKIRAADRLILHFPLWWFGPPAMLKGWCDRALTHGHIHDVDNRFDTGLCRGKRALFCVSTGSRAEESGPGGKEGEFSLLLWPLAYTLRYVGMSVLQPVAVHGVHGYHRGDRQAALEARLAETLAGQAALLARFETLPEITFNPDSDFDATGRLKPGAPSHSPFIRNGG